MNIFQRCTAALLLAAAFAFPSPALATDLDEIPPPPVEWGTIPQEDLEMKTFPADTNASAVILCDYGQTKMNDDFNLLFKRHLRVKILNEKGFRWGTQSIDLWDDKERGETIDNIEAITYTLDANGKVVEHELDSDDIVTEKVTNKYVRVKFTLPALEAGCVIEIRYEITARSWMSMRNWTFQHDEPVRWSEYRVLHPLSFSFGGVTQGYERFAADEQFETVVYASGALGARYGSNMLKCSFRRWAMKDLPALREEPYITTLEDYYSTVKLQLSGYSLGAGMIERVLHTWEEVVKELLDNPYLGRKVKVTGDVEDLAQKLTQNIPSPVEKMKAVYAWVSRSIVWDRHQTWAAERTVNNVLETKKGNSAEINYLLIALCRAAGLQADPIILSTRSNGKIQDLYPIVDQFNFTMARVMIGDMPFFLDATDPVRPFNIVPSKTLGCRALVIQEGPKAEWTNIMSKAKSISVTAAALTLDADGAVKGTLEGIFKDYANLSVRDDLQGSSPLDIAKKYFFVDASKITIDSVNVINRDSVDQPIKLKTVVSGDTYAQAAGDMIYINPHVVTQVKDNPFKSPSRKFPVDYTYPRESTTYVNLTIPDSFEIKEVLPNKYLSMDGKVAYKRELVIDQNRIQVMTKVEILSKEIEPKNYQRLKEFYSAMIQTESQQLVLQKIKPQPAAAPVPAAAGAETAQAPAKAKRPAARKK